MAQTAKIIDITRSYIPVDPKTYPNNLLYSYKEDAPTENKPIVAYEGYNFMPTGVGYKSFFGIAQQLGIDALSSNCDYLLIYQLPTYENKIIALCDDGIWTKIGNSTGAWTHEIVLSVPDIGQSLSWSYCLLERTLYCYRAGGAVFYKIDNKAYYPPQLPPFAAALTYIEHITSAAGVPAATYTYQIARRDATSGLLSAPTAVISVVVTSAGFIKLSFTAVANTSSYRIYRTKAGVTTAYDHTPTFGSAVLFWIDYNALGSVVVLPEQSLLNPLLGTIHQITPNFLNMAGQQGLFRAGMRLGFWDSENSVSISSIDSHADFIPSIETQAGNTLFSDVSGRIVTVRDYGDGFIIYATSSIVYVRQDLQATLQWDPKVIVSGVGIMYPKQVAAGLYPEQHFAWTSNGLLKILPDGKGEFELVELWEYLKEASNPVYLRLVENRYLFIELLDAEYLEGRVSFSYEAIAPLVYTFPGYTPTTVDFSVKTAAYNLSGIDQVSKGGLDEMQALAASAIAAASAPVKKTGSLYRPRWVCYLSADYLPDVADITWTNIPCTTIDPNGIEKNMCPGSAGLASNYNTGPTNKIQSTGITWDLLQFIAVQMAIWETVDSKRAAYLNAILTRSASVTKKTDVASCVPSQTRQECAIGTYLLPPSYAPEWGITPCSFFLNRLHDQVMDVKRIKADYTTCSAASIAYTSPGPFNVNVVADSIHSFMVLPPIITGDAETVGFSYYSNIRSAQLGDADPSNNAFWLNSSYAYSAYGNWNSAQLSINGFSSLQGIVNIFVFYQGANTYIATLGGYVSCPAGYTATLIDGNPVCVKNLPIERVDKMVAYNQGLPRKEVHLDQPFCTIAGWDYTDANGVARFIARPSDTCNSPIKPDWNSNTASKPSIIPLEKELVKPVFNSYAPITVPELPHNPVAWPETSITIPGGTFLLQDGAIGPIYPTFEGAYVYDLLLKKWGKIKQQYKQIVDFLPINVLADQIISTIEQQTQAGILSIAGRIHLFDSYPEYSYIKYGKIGYYRLGLTDAEEIKVNLKNASDFSIVVEASLDGKNVEGGLVSADNFTNVNKAILPLNLSARWYNITISGHYDLTHLEFRGHLAGRR